MNTHLTLVGLIGNLNVMFRAGDAEEVNRPEPEAVAGPSIERNLDFLVAFLPCAVVAHLLEASEIGRA